MTEERGPGSQSAGIVRRLRARPVSSWQLADREKVMRSALQNLADLTAEAAGEPRRLVPDVGATALADQLAVLAADAAAAGVPADKVERLLSELASGLSVRPSR